MAVVKHRHSIDELYEIVDRMEGVVTGMQTVVSGMQDVVSKMGEITTNVTDMTGALMTIEGAVSGMSSKIDGILVADGEQTDTLHDILTVLDTVSDRLYSTARSKGIGDVMADTYNQIVGTQTAPHNLYARLSECRDGINLIAGRLTNDDKTITAGQQLQKIANYLNYGDEGVGSFGYKITSFLSDTNWGTNADTIGKTLAGIRNYLANYAYGSSANSLGYLVQGIRESLRNTNNPTGLRTTAELLTSLNNK